jgi:hypothetical protein
MLKQLDAFIGLVVVMSVLSLLITAATQLVSAVLGLRGKNLADALEAMIHKIDPEFDSQVRGLSRQLVDHILTHPVISDSALSMSAPWTTTWKRASAIRSNELYEILQDIAFRDAAQQRAASATSPSITANAVGASAATSKPAILVPKSIQEGAQKLLDRLNTPVTIVNPPLAESEKDWGVKPGNIEAFRNLDKWFRSAQDRASQWFAMNTRISSVIWAFGAAFFLQLDAFALMNRLSIDSELRARLSAASPALTNQAAQVFADASTFSTNTFEPVVKRLDKNFKGLSDLLNQSQPTSASSEAVHEWITNKVQGTPLSESGRQIWTAYQKEAKQLTKERLELWEQQFGAISDEFSKSGFELRLQPNFWEWKGEKVPGIFVTGILLSLGAPFWFNLLKTLMNLKPLLAQKVEAHPEGEPTTAK